MAENTLGRGSKPRDEDERKRSSGSSGQVQEFQSTGRVKGSDVSRTSQESSQRKQRRNERYEQNAGQTEFGSQKSSSKDIGTEKSTQGSMGKGAKGETRARDERNRSGGY